jgi:TrfA protein
MTNPMDATLKAIFGKFRASFTRRNEMDVLESPPDQPLALPGSNASESIAPLESGAVERGRSVPPLSEKVSPELQAVLDERVRAAKERMERKEASSNPLALPESNVVRLPMWPEPARRIPNGMLRSALFGAIKKGPRKHMKEEKIAAQDGIEIRYSGERLDQCDLDVWGNVLHLCRDQEMGSKFRFTGYEMLKLLGMTDCGKNRKTLHSRILRLTATAVQVTQGRRTYFGSLLPEGYRDEDTNEYVVTLNPTLRIFLEGEQFTQLDWNVRHALAGQQLAQWLHGYYASHAQPFPVKIETLLNLSGSENEAVRSSHQTLRKALDAVTNASNANAQPFSYEVRGDLVHVERKPSLTQKRHLAKKTTKKSPKGKK